MLQRRGFFLVAWIGPAVHHIPPKCSLASLSLLRLGRVEGNGNGLVIAGQLRQISWVYRLCYDETSQSLVRIHRQHHPGTTICINVFTQGVRRIQYEDSGDAHALSSLLRPVCWDAQQGLGTPSLSLSVRMLSLLAVIGRNPDDGAPQRASASHTGDGNARVDPPAGFAGTHAVRRTDDRDECSARAACCHTGFTTG